MYTLFLLHFESSLRKVPISVGKYYMVNLNGKLFPAVVNTICKRIRYSVLAVCLGMGTQVMYHGTVILYHESSRHKHKDILDTFDS